MHESQTLYKGQQGFVLSMHFQTGGNAANSSFSPEKLRWDQISKFDSLVKKDASKVLELESRIFGSLFQRWMLKAP